MKVSIGFCLFFGNFLGIPDDFINNATAFLCASEHERTVILMGKTDLLLGSVAGINLLHCLALLGKDPRVKFDQKFIKHILNIRAKKDSIKRLKIDDKDMSGYTPLHYAFREKNAQLIKIFLDLGANIDEKNNKGQTPLHLLGTPAESACTKTPDSVSSIIEIVEDKLTNSVTEERNLADALDVKDSSGMTPLHLAVIANNLEAIKVFLAHNAKPDIKDNLGRTPLHMAITLEYRDSMELLTQETDLLLQDNNGETPLHYAAAKSLSTLQYFYDKAESNVGVQKDVGFELLNKEQKTALYIAANNCLKEEEEAKDTKLAFLLEKIPEKNRMNLLKSSAHYNVFGILMQQHALGLFLPYFEQKVPNFNAELKSLVKDQTFFAGLIQFSNLDALIYIYNILDHNSRNNILNEIDALSYAAAYSQSAIIKQLLDWGVDFEKSPKFFREMSSITRERVMDYIPDIKFTSIQKKNKFLSMLKDADKEPFNYSFFFTTMFLASVGAAVSFLLTYYDSKKITERKYPSVKHNKQDEKKNKIIKNLRQLKKVTQNQLQDNAKNRSVFLQT